MKGGGRRNSANTFVGRCFAVLSAAPLLAAMGSASAAEADESRILYFEPLHVATDATSNAQQKSSDARQLQFDAYGRRFQLSLQSNDKLSPLVQAKTGVAPVELLKGQINGVSGSWVRLGIADGQMHGMLWDGAELYIIEPVSKLGASLPAGIAADANATAIFRMQDVAMKPGATSCASDPALAAGKGNVAYKSLLSELKSTPVIMQAAGASRRLEVSALGDTLLSTEYGSEAQARTEILLRLNNVDGIFSSQLGVEIQVPSVDIGDSLSATTAASTLLDELGVLRKNSPKLNSRGLTHMFTGRDLDGSTVGIAYVNSLCDVQYGVGLSEASGRGSWMESLIAAHEIGHNFGAVHDGSGTCSTTPTGQFLMSPSINGSDKFSSCSLGLMQPNVPAAACITSLPPADAAIAANLGELQRVVGRSFQWNVSVLNSGGLATVNTRAEIAIPASVVVESAFVVGGSCVSGAGMVQCQLGQIAGGSSSVVQLSLRGDLPSSNAVPVSVSADNESNTGNNQGSGTLKIQPEADLAVGLQSPTSVSDRFDVAVSARNLSATAVDNVTLTLALPAGMTVNSAALNGGDCTVQTDAIRCSLTSLAAGGSVSGAISLRATSSGTAVLTARVSGDYVDPVATNDSAEASLAMTGTLTTSTQATGSGAGVSSGSGGGGGGGSSGPLLLSALLGLLRLKNFQRRSAPVRR